MIRQISKNSILLIGVLLLLAVLLCGLGFTLFSQEKTQPIISISGLKCQSATINFGIRPMGNNWNNQTVKVNNIFYPNSIFACAPSHIVFINSDNYKFFRVSCAIEDSVGKNGSVIFVVHTDNSLAYQSPIIRGGNTPLPIVIDITGKNKIELIVRKGNDNDFAHAVWLNPEFFYEKPSIKTPPPFAHTNDSVANIPWETGSKPFPNQVGLMAWKLLVIIFYLCLLLYFIRRHKTADDQHTLKAYLFSKLKQPSFYILLLTGSISAWIISPMFSPGLPTAWDTGMHLMGCYTMKICLSNFTLSGFNPYWYLGVQDFLFNAPLFYLATNFIYLLSVQIISFEFCFKLIFLSCYFLLPFVFYWLARQLNIPALPSSLAALCVPAFSAIHGVGIEAIFLVGLLRQCFSLLIFCLALGAVFNSLKYGGKHLFIAGMLIGFLNLAHVISMVFLYILLSLFAFLQLFPYHNRSYQYNLKAIFRLFIPAIIGLLISSFFIFSSIQFSSLRGPETAFGLFTYYDFLGGLLSGGYYATFPLHLIVLLGLIFSFFLRKRELYVIAILAILIPYLATSEFITHFNLFGLPWRLVFQYRTLPYIAVFFMLFLALGFQLILVSFYRASYFFVGKNKIIASFSRTVFCILLIVFILLNVLPKIQRLSPLIKTVSALENVDQACFFSAWNWIKNNTPENIIIDYEHRDAPGNLGFLDIGNRTNYFTDRYTLSGGYTEISRVHNYDFMGRIDTLGSSELYPLLKRYNVSYFYTWSKAAKSNLSTNPAIFHKVYENDLICIWQVMGHDFRYLANDEIKINAFSYFREKIKWKVYNPTPNNRVVVALAYHPNWNLYINGTKSTTLKTDDNLTSFDILSAGNNDILLVFRKSFAEYVYYMLSFLSFSFCIFGIVRPSFLKQIVTYVKHFLKYFADKFASRS